MRWTSFSRTRPPRAGKKTLPDAAVKKLIRKIYDQQGRSIRWKLLKRKSDKILRARARVYWENQRKTLLAPDASRAFFKNAKAYSSRERPKNFDVRQLFDEKIEDDEIIERQAEHFASVNADLTGLAYPIPTTYSCPFPLLTPQQVEKRTKEIRKPKSIYTGRSSAPTSSPTLRHILNCVNLTDLA